MEIELSFETKTLYLASFIEYSFNMGQFCSMGVQGPNICIMCFRESETVNHLLVHCEFSKQVCKYVKYMLKFVGQ